jgi:alkaline phosphatase D
VAATLAGCRSGRRADPQPPSSTRRVDTSVALPEPAPPPFALGVASGDPLPDAVVIWTRLHPAPAAAVVDVDWEVARDEAFAQVIRRGTTQADRGAAHAVHVDVRGLDADSWYWYRFRTGGDVSPTGRTRTTPAVDAQPTRLRLVHASCQSYEAGFYCAHRHLAAEEVDLVVFVGDAIYDGGVSRGSIREHDGPAVRDLAGYRNRWALYRSDPDLQAAHAAAPWVMTRDDHEVVNNDSTATPVARRAAALRAMWEHMPTRVAPPQAGRIALHRSVQWGSLATIWLLDTRQDRTPQPCDRALGIGDPCDGDEQRVLLGTEQEQWLAAGLQASTTAWNAIAQQVMLAPLDLIPGQGSGYNLDQWDGYVTARRRLLALLAAAPNPVVLTGDLHAAVVADLRVDTDGNAAEHGAAVGVELVCPGLTSQAPTALRVAAPLVSAANAHVHHLDAGVNGYVRNVIEPTQWIAEQRAVSTIARRDGAIATDARFGVVSGGREATEL